MTDYHGEHKIFNSELGPAVVYTRDDRVYIKSSDGVEILLTMPDPVEVVLVDDDTILLTNHPDPARQGLYRRIKDNE